MTGDSALDVSSLESSWDTSVRAGLAVSSRLGMTDKLSAVPPAIAAATSLSSAVPPGVVAVALVAAAPDTGRGAALAFPPFFFGGPCRRQKRETPLNSLAGA